LKIKGRGATFVVIITLLCSLSLPGYSAHAESRTNTGKSTAQIGDNWQRDDVLYVNDQIPLSSKDYYVQNNGIIVVTNFQKLSITQKNKANFLSMAKSSSITAPIYRKKYVSKKALIKQYKTIGKAQKILNVGGLSIFLTPFLKGYAGITYASIGAAVEFTKLSMKSVLNGMKAGHIKGFRLTCKYVFTGWGGTPGGGQGYPTYKLSKITYKSVK
jgi:hypothetical protein